MEILGSTFDDSVFEEPRNRVASALITYEPKRCEALWFCCDGDVEGALEEQKMLKYRGDLAYRRKQYQVSLDEYTSCLSLVPAGNASVRRDVLEGIARCCCHLGKKEEALNICEKLRTEASNTCHLTCVLQLELSIHEHRDDVIYCISALQQLCCLHPYHPWHWLNLAMSYNRLQQTDNSPKRSRPPHQNHTETEQQQDQNQTTNDTVKLQASMCFIRTRLLIEILRIQQFAFVLETSEKVLANIEEALHVLQLKEKTLQTISEVMAEDLNPEKMREENQDGESLSGLYIKDFDDRWWNKLYTKLQQETET